MAGVVAGPIVAVGLHRIAIHQRTRIQRMRHTAHLVLDGVEEFAIHRIDDILEAILVLIAFLDDQAMVLQPLVRAGEISDVNLQMVAVVFRNRLGGLAENQILMAHTP